MVSANFLAEVDMHLRNIMSQVSATKRDARNIDRPFGGINILFVGDFHQLDPASGTPINAIPTGFLRSARRYAPSATEEHGQYIFGGSGPGCVQGMDELITCNRLEEQDEWLLQVQREFRENNLSMDSHAFLHGRPTSKPGSWTNGQTTCDNPKCSEQLAAIREDNGLECEKCKYEREKRKLVVTDKSDARLVQEVFRCAPAIFPNNDNKYHAGKKRSEA